MLEWMSGQSPILLAFLATLFTWGITALGAAMVFIFKSIKLGVLNIMLAFAAGVMIAASFWSLLAPAIEYSKEGHMLPSWLIVGIGFFAGAVLISLTDKILPFTMMKADAKEKGGVKSQYRRSILLVLSITLHNIPEGLAVGVAFGAITNGDMGALMAALSVAFGIGIQNFPEGAAVSIPMRREGVSRVKSFLIGQASAIVEPIAGVLGALLVTSMTAILPYALAFAAGAMIFVVAEELIPESQQNRKEGSHIATIGCILGFITMMILDVALS